MVISNRVDGLKTGVISCCITCRTVKFRPVSLPQISLARISSVAGSVRRMQDDGYDRGFCDDANEFDPVPNQPSLVHTHSSLFHDM